MNKFRAKLRYFLQIRKKKCNFAAKFYILIDFNL
jgi:hypothetical protein